MCSLPKQQCQVLWAYFRYLNKYICLLKTGEQESLLLHRSWLSDTRSENSKETLGGLQNDVLKFLSAFQNTLENSARKKNHYTYILRYSHVTEGWQTRFTSCSSPIYQNHKTTSLDPLPFPAILSPICGRYSQKAGLKWNGALIKKNFV